MEARLKDTRLRLERKRWQLHKAWLARNLLGAGTGTLLALSVGGGVLLGFLLLIQSRPDLRSTLLATATLTLASFLISGGLFRLHHRSRQKVAWLSQELADDQASPTPGTPPVIQRLPPTPERTRTGPMHSASDAASYALSEARRKDAAQRWVDTHATLLRAQRTERWIKTAMGLCCGGLLGVSFHLVPVFLNGDRTSVEMGVLGTVLVQLFLLTCWLLPRHTRRVKALQERLALEQQVRNRLEEEV